MNFGKLILAILIPGPLGYGAGWVAGWLAGSGSPFLLGIGGFAIAVLLAYFFGGVNDGKSIAQTGDNVDGPLFNMNAIDDYCTDRDFIEVAKRPE